MTTGQERRYTDRLEEFSDRHRVVVDVVVVLALMGCAALGGSLTMPGARPPDQGRAATVLMGVSCLALLRHRTRPRTALVVTALCTVAAVGAGYLLTPLLLAPVMAALYWLAAHTDDHTTRLFGVPTIAALTLAAVFADTMHSLSLPLRTIGPVFWLLLPLAAGRMTQLRRAYVTAVQARAEHAERTREEEARLRVTEERMRIARELHDVVAHHLALANAQAGTAAHLVGSSPEQAQRILTDLTGTTSSALRELKATLGLLRRNGETDSAPLEPAPGLHRLPELVASCASAGVGVTVSREGEPRPLSPGVDLTAFRIVQEALTNVTKHATTETAHVRLVYSGARLLISVTDDGPAAPAACRLAPGGGFGVMGMRERAHSVGGALRAGPRPGGGFEVTTELPLQPHESAPEPTH
ncbi:two-component sensor kinase [Streptomyces zinciresistens K42]|uniref:histidine kinase n=1 Tax=Streptomyces zinciresistens K42 TaxID=700597 RepID=G2G6H8_9ACTN|nr:sensor histidine kinase [Streptomyces zinciresistens]EGX60869.1 two-component sensor kinase [Streptomyces zinciresistens K42]